MGKVKRTLSVVLAVAMVVTMVPQTGMAVYAQEENPAIETEEPEVDVLTPEETTEVSTEDPEDADEAPAEDAQAEDTEDGSVNEDGGAEDVEAPAEETPEVEEPADEETPEVTEGDKSVTDNEVMGDEVAKHTVTATFPEQVTITSEQVQNITSGTPVEEVEAGKDLIFTVALQENNKTTYRITKVAYKVDAGKEVDKTADVKDGACEFTITKEEFTGDVTITVDVAKIHTITFEKTQPGIAKVTDIKVDGTDYDPKEYPQSEDEGDWTVQAIKGQKVSFKLVADDLYKVTEVKYGETVLKADKSGVYSFTIGEEKEDLTIGTALDETKAYAFVFKVNGDKDSAKIAKVEWTDKAEYKDDAAPEPDENGKYVVRNSKVKVTITVDGNNYELGKVKVGTKELESTGENVYEVDLTASKTVTLEAETIPKGREAETKVQIEKKDSAAHVELTEVKVDDDVASPGEDGYEIPKDAKRLVFTIVATGSYLPVVTYGDEQTLLDVASEKPVAKTNKTTYTYSVLAKQIKDDEKYTIDEKADMKKIEFVYEGADKDKGAKVVKSINGKATDKEEVLRGTVVTFQVTAAANSNLTSVKVDGKEQKVTNKKTSEFTVTVNADTTITVTTEGLYKAAALKKYDNDTAGDELTPVKNVYNVSYDGKYAASVFKGEGKDPVALSGVKVKNGKNEIEAAELGTIKDGNIAVIDLTKAVVDDKNVAAGNSLTVELYVAGNDKAVATYTLSVSKVVSTITLQAAATQTADTVKSYTIKTDGEISKLEVKPLEEGDKNVVTKAEIDPAKGVLEITTGQSLGKATVKVVAGSSEDAASATIEITTKELISAATPKPTVSLKAASDISLTLTLGSKNIETPVAGEVYYEVKVAPKAGTESNARPEGLKETVDTVYVKRTGASDEARVVVGEADKLGTGAAWSYDVTVALVHISDDSNKEEIGSKIVKYDDAESRGAAFSGTFSTQNPTWEAALKLKKGKTTVYTGQKNVVIATPQFSKITTYTVLEDKNVEDRSYPGEDNDSALKLRVENGDIVADTTEKTAVGKHTVQVTAATEEGKVYASRATIVINVVRGIEGLEVSVPSDSIYKAPKKAATLKATPIYNGNKTTPKTKKVTWEIIKSYDELSKKETALAISDALYGMVTVKNGTVTVNKNYTLALDNEDTKPNTFVIKVTANDFDGNTEVGYSKEITVTNEGLNISTVAIVQKQDGDNYKVVAKPDGKNPVDIQATDANGACVVAFTGAVNQEEYSEEELKAATVPVSNLSLKSSSAKNVAVAADGLITVTKPANKVKLTATANDGSKAKAELLVNVTYDKTQDADSKQKDLAMKLSLGEVQQAAGEDVVNTIDYKEFYNPAEPNEQKIDDLKFEGSTSSILLVQVMTKESDEESSYKNAPAFTNYKLTVSGGKIIAQSGSKAFIAADKRNVTLTVTDNGSLEKTKPTVTYKLTNNGIPETTGLFKPSVKVGNKLHKEAETEEQKVTINLDKIPATSVPTSESGEKLAAKVEVDFSAMKPANWDQLLEFASLMEKNVYEVEGYNNKKGHFTITFKPSEDADKVAFALNSYKLKVTVGTVKEDKFTALSQTVAATVSVDKVKTFTYKPTTSYKIATRDGGVLLTGKANIPTSDYTVEGYKLLNVNNKGVVNKFIDNFDILDGKLVIKANVDPSKIDKKDLTGYLTYTADTKKPYYNKGNGTGTNTVKITVKVNDKKAAAKYAVDGKPQIDAKKDSETTIDVTVNGAITKMAYAIVDGTPDWEAEAIADTGKVKLTTKKEDGLKVGNTYSVKLLVVSNDSFYKSKVKDAKDQEGTDEGKAYKDAMKDYGVKLTVSVKVKKSDLEIAKERLEEWLADASKEKPTWLKNDLTTADKLIAVIKDTDKGAGLDAEKVTVEIAKKGEEQDQNDYEFEKAELNKAGSIKGNLTVTVNGESETVAIDLVIPEKAITKDEAQDEIQKADSVKNIKVTNEDLDNSTVKDQAICDAAQAVIGNGYYKVTVKADNGLKGTQASTSEGGSATITLEIKDKDNEGDTPTEVLLSYDIDKLPEE